MHTILDKITSSDVVTNPFPHVIVENALDEDLYLQLAECFPQELLPEANQGNAYTYYKARKALREKKINRLWYEFIKLHTSNVFYQRFLEVFGYPLLNLHPDLEKRLGKKLENLKPKVRHSSKFSFSPLAIDCQLARCSPVTETGKAVRSQGNDAGPHIDRPVALYAGLLYFRLPEDNSTGGDLQLYKTVTDHPKYDNTNHVPDNMVECFRTIPYTGNTMVFFLNSPYSIHGVSLRSKTIFPRLHVNFISELKYPLFDIEKWRI